MKYSILTNVLLLLFTLNTSAYTEKVGRELTFSPGMSIVNWSENESAISGVGNVLAPEAGSASFITGKFTYPFHSNHRSTFVIDVLIPLIGSQGQLYLGSSVGWQYYFSGRSNRVLFKTGNKILKVDTNFKWFVGADAGIGYLTYVTETTKKQDTFIELGPSIGMSYQLNTNWAFSADAKLSRGVGSSTSTFNYKIFAGLKYFIGYF